jgi:RNA polymerase sigma-70 factor (ECF subfamily)
MGSVDVPEQLLWEEARGGDARAFAEIFDLHRDRAFRHAYRLLQDANDAEDAAAIAFLELWRRRDDVRVVDGSVLPWLLVTVTNTTRNLRRARRRYGQLLMALPHGDHHHSAEDDAGVDVILDRTLAGAIASLTPLDAQLVSLVALEGYTVAEAAPLLGMSPGAARTRLSRLRSTLRQRLGHDTLSDYLSQEAT